MLRDCRLGLSSRYYMSEKNFNRISVLVLVMIFVTSAIILRLFYLQVIAHSYYADIAQRERQGYTTLPSRRGEIQIEDYNSGESYKIATNTTLNMIYADPTLIEDPVHVGETLAPLLFELEIEKELDKKRIEEEYRALNDITDLKLRTEAESKIKFKTDEELATSFKDGLIATLSAKTRDVILITEGLDAETAERIKESSLEGIEVSESGNLYAFPGKISDKNNVASSLAQIFGTDVEDLESILLGKNRYVILKRKLEPDISEKINEIIEKDQEATRDEQGNKIEAPLKFLGIRMKEEYFRFYPEQSLAAQVLGYVNSAGDGQYGIEGTYNDILRGKDGIFTSQIDANGNQITVADSVIENAIDGANITLTIDRAIQLEVEKLLAAGVKTYEASSGQAIVIDPKTGAILAMAQSPTFNPNVYGDIFEKYQIDLTDEQKKDLYTTGEGDAIRYWFYIQKDPPLRIELFRDKENQDVYYAYKNSVGPEVYKNKMVNEVFEPGSIFKPLAMAAAINAGEVEPNTTYMETGPVKVDDYEIHTYDDTYRGLQTMTNVLEHSSNVGMVFIAQKLGRTLFYNYLKAFGFTERTGIGILDEALGTLAPSDTWTDSELVTKAFGQGISVTPIQMVEAYTAVANNGVMLQPYLVKRIDYADGSSESFEPRVVRQVLTEETSQKLTAMMVSTAENGYRFLVIDGHYFAGKSGTAQTYKWGVALKGRGTTIASYVGFGPIDDPKFLILIKLDYPRANEFGANTSGRIFKDIASYLFDYYNVPPDKK